MRHVFGWGLLLAALIVRGAGAQDTPAAPPTDAAAEEGQEAAIRAAGQAYVKAFNDHDAKAVAAFWSPEAVYTNRLTGERVVGQQAIEKQFTALFQTADKLALEVHVESIQFVSPNVAVEHGAASFVAADSTPEQVDYSAVYVRRGGKWLLDRVTDDPQPEVRSNYSHLKQIEWLIGAWVDQDEHVKISTECAWTKNKNFITRSFTVSSKQQVELSGMQIIGWDPVKKEIRSWTFDSDGGFSEGSWSQAENQWFVRKRGATGDGHQATTVNVITKVDDDSFKFQSIQRTVDGQLLPNIDEVLVVRR